RINHPLSSTSRYISYKIEVLKILQEKRSGTTALTVFANAFIFRCVCEGGFLVQYSYGQTINRISR
ncbi:hypothetical protein KBA63_05180, partial [Candidatus Woesebacteria bacterium]|nr:hypothetical protein [Candidatus Woesebacteria bacterium]